MAEGFITRRGGVGAAERTASPNINFVSKTGTQIVVTFTNSEANEVDIFYGITSTLTDKVTVAASGTSSNVTFSGLDPNTPYTISAYAIVTDATLKKIKSEIISTSITTDDIQYTAATGGTTLEYNESGKRYKSHTFTSSGNFVVSQVGNGDRNQVDYLIIAGGGGGGFGGGGAGGYRTTNGTSGANSSAESKVTVTAQSYGITIGGGGSAGNANNTRGQNGNNSSALSITSTGGGGGGVGNNNSLQTGLNGGSGGGGGTPTNGNGDGGIGTAGQGTNGGFGKHISGVNIWGGGGGGAGSAGQNADSVSAAGGNGLVNTIRTGSSETRASGGGGGSLDAGSGGPAGSSNTGTGGGGGAWSSGSGAAGGSGIVVIRYEIAPSA